MQILRIGLHAEIDLTYFRRVHHGMRFTRRDYPATVEHDQMADNAQQSMNNMFNPDDGYSALLDTLDEINQLMALGVRQAAGDFIKQEQAWFGGKRPGEFQS